MKIIRRKVIMLEYQSSNNMPSYRNTLDSYESEVSSKYHIVNWSGGCDSTLLLYELLKKYGPNRVKAVTYKYPYYDETKFMSEQMKRDQFKEFLKKENLDYFCHTTYKMECDNSKVWAQGGGNAQAPGWLMSLLYCQDGDYFYDTSIKNDDLTIKNEDLKQAIEHLSNILSRKIILRQPYLYFTKEYIIAKLIKYKIYKYTWYCEMPESVGKVCCKCEPCALHTKSLAALSIMANDPYVMEQAERLGRSNISKYKKMRANVNKEKEVK